MEASSVILLPLGGGSRDTNAAAFLSSLRHKRLRLHRVLNRLEPQVAAYRAKLAEVEAAILALDPQLWLPPRRYQPNPHFARNELPRLAIDILRKAGEPLPIRVIVARALAAKGVTHPDRRTLKITRVRLQQVSARFQAKGITVKVGRGKETRRGLVLECLSAAVTDGKSSRGAVLTQISQSKGTFGQHT